MVLSATAGAFLFSGPLTGSILMMHDILGIAGWKWVMFLEGGGSILVGIVAAGVLVSKPMDARWLSEEEKRALAQQLHNEDVERDQLNREPGKMSLLRNRSLLFFCVIFFTMTMTGYTLVFWLPQIIQRIQGFSSFGIGLLTAVPWLCAIIAINLLSGFSDRHRNKLDKALGMAMLVAACGTFMATLGSPWFGFVAMIVACIGSKVSATFFWPMPQGELPASIVAPGIALVNSIGNLGGFFAPTVFGYLEMKTGSTTGGLYALTSVSIITGLWLLLRRKPSPPSLNWRKIMSDSPVIKSMRVIPVAGYDSMLLNIGGAHNCYFTRILVMLTDSAGRTGVGKVLVTPQRWHYWNALGRRLKAAICCASMRPSARCLPVMRGYSKVRTLMRFIFPR